MAATPITAHGVGARPELFDKLTRRGVQVALVPLLLLSVLVGARLLIAVEALLRLLLPVAEVRLGLRREVIALSLLLGVGVLIGRPVAISWGGRRRVRIVGRMTPSRRSHTRWSERTIRPSHTMLPYALRSCSPNRL